MDQHQALALEPPAQPLAVPPPVATVAPEQATAAIKLPPEETTKLDAEVASFAQQLLSLDTKAPEYAQRLDAIGAMGNAEIARSAAVSNRLLERPARAMNNGLFDESSPVSRSLLDLRRTIESLDPSRQGDLFGTRKLLWIIPLGSKLVDYFRSYESSQKQLNAIIETLYHSKDELLRDNAAIDAEKASMWSLMEKLEQYAYLAQKLDDALSAKLTALDTSDPERAKVLREDALFYARQKRTDILTQLAVNVQGYLALDLIRKNNIELVKGVDRATTTTVAALRTAIMVAQALANQKLVLDQITALNTTTSHMIDATATMLRTQSARIGEQASTSTIDVNVLQHAFDNVFAALDDVSNYKIKAVDSMQQTVSALETQVDRAKTYLDKTRQSEVTQAMGTLTNGAGTSDIARIG